MDPNEPPFDLVGAEVALYRAGRVARRRKAEMRRLRALRLVDSLLDVLVRSHIGVRDTIGAWRAGAPRSTRDPEMVGAEVALHRAARVARRRAAVMPKRRSAAGRRAGRSGSRSRGRPPHVGPAAEPGGNTAAGRSLFRAQRDDRVEPRRAPGRVPAEEDSDPHREHGGEPIANAGISVRHPNMASTSVEESPPRTTPKTPPSAARPIASAGTATSRRGAAPRPRAATRFPCVP